jgi:hypothetical protein
MRKKETKRLTTRLDLRQRRNGRLCQLLRALRLHRIHPACLQHVVPSTKSEWQISMQRKGQVLIAVELLST